MDKKQPRKPPVPVFQDDKPIVLVSVRSFDSTSFVMIVISTHPCHLSRSKRWWSSVPKRYEASSELVFIFVPSFSGISSKKITAHKVNVNECMMIALSISVVETLKSPSLYCPERRSARVITGKEKDSPDPLLLTKFS
jgi:hypothetical protein